MTRGKSGGRVSLKNAPRQPPAIKEIRGKYEAGRAEIVTSRSLHRSKESRVSDWSEADWAL